MWEYPLFQQQHSYVKEFNVGTRGGESLPFLSPLFYHIKVFGEVGEEEKGGHVCAGENAMKGLYRGFT